jgi:cytochrome c553
MKLVSYALTLAISVTIANNAIAENKAKIRTWDQTTEEQKFAIEATANLDNGREIYEVCAACHLYEGWGREDGTFPQIAGQHCSVLIKQWTDIRALNRYYPTCMHHMFPFFPSNTGRIIEDVQALADVTAYISILLMNPNNGVGEGKDLKHGEKLYKKNCVKCHGETGYGSSKKFYPRIQAQHYKYMLRQFEWIRDGKRRNANPDMVKQINSFTERDMKAVIDYVSRFKPPKKDLAYPGWKPLKTDD